MPGFMWDLGFWTGYSPPVSAGPCFPAQPLPKAHTHVFHYGALASGAASGSARSLQPPLAARLHFPGGAGAQQPRNCGPWVCRGMCVPSTWAGAAIHGSAELFQAGQGSPLHIS